MTELQAVTVNGKQAQSLHVHVPRVGPWFCDAKLVDDAPSGAATIQIEGFTLQGTVEPQHSGNFALTGTARIIGGAGRWGSRLTATAERNDAGIRASTIALSVAKQIGENLADFTGGQQVLGVKYVRESTTASAILEDVARGAPWWVDFAGVTHVGPRTTQPAKAGAITLLEYDTSIGLATLTLDELNDIQIGTIITDERLDTPITVGAYEIIVKPDSIRVLAWCGAVAQTPIIDAFRAMIKRAGDGKIYGKYKYRVTRLDVNRVNVQAVSKSDGLPDILSVAMVPGIAGAYAKLALGAIVYIEFIAGDRADPEITGFAGRGQPGFLPQNLLLGATDDSAPLAARQGDMVTVPLPPMVITGTLLIAGTPTEFTGVAISELQQALGIVSGGSPNGVKIG